MCATTGQLSMIPSGGGDLTSMGVRGSANPMWAPANVGNSNIGGESPGASSSSTALSLELIKQLGTKSFMLRAVDSKADPNASFLLQSSSDLKNWNTSLTATGKLANGGIIVTDGGRHAYYRLVEQD